MLLKVSDNETFDTVKYSCIHCIQPDCRNSGNTFPYIMLPSVRRLGQYSML